MFQDRCPVCGTQGKPWDKDPDVKVCPNCATLFSEFGLVLESQKEQQELWN